MAIAQPDTPQSLSARLEKSRVGMRPELQFTRHIFRGKTSYVVRDPITFGSHSLTLEDYEILIRIDPQRTLGEIFQELVKQGLLESSDESTFFEFVVTLHSLGFLSLQISDSNRLYRRFLAKQRRKRMGRWMGVLFLQVPLVNPDTFLTRTVARVRFLFTRGVFVAWLALLAIAAVVLSTRWSDFQGEFADLFAARNLLTLWCTMIGLKLFHEMGHGYACKLFGGQLPEAGLYLIALTPCAYVDASASWGFHRKLHRVVVGLAGMYFELMVAALAALAWSMTEPGALHSVLHNVVILASVVTVGFNINPLMRYDGYYVLSDLLEMPNLRARGERAMLHCAKRVLLGLRAPDGGETLGMRGTLLAFGVLSALYRAMVILSIAALIATQVFLVGVVLGAAYVGFSVFQLLRKALAFLWWAEETAPVRLRAVTVSVVAILGGGALLFLLPAPTRVHADGIVARAHQATLRAELPGILTELPARLGQTVSAGTILAQISNPAPFKDRSSARGRLAAAETRAHALEFVDRVEARQEAANVVHLREQLEQLEKSIALLAPVAPFEGELLDCLPPERLGSYVNRGEIVARLGAGPWVVETLLTESQLGLAHPEPGDLVEFRSSATPGQTWTATILRVEPLGDRHIEDLALTQYGGGNIVADPQTRQASHNYFHMVIQLDDTAPLTPRSGQTGILRLKGQPEPIGVTLYRKLLVFLHRLSAG